MIGYFLKMKLRTIFYRFCIICFFIFIIYEFKFHEKLLSINTDNKKLPIILWWTPFYDNNLTKHINCGVNKCLLTENRSFISEPKTIVYLFYGSKFDPYDLPIPRKRSDLWAMIHEESPKNLALFLYENSHHLFNFTSTFSRYSHFPITLQYLPNIDVLISKKYVKPVEEKNKLLDHLAPILYIQSDCVTPLERDSYVVELMKYVSVDSYGQCLNNKILPDTLSDNHLNNLYSDDFMHFVAQYKFVIAFENAVCDDYITEKLWRPLIAGSVPIYMGSPSVMDWLPNNHSVILATDFKYPKDLVEYILKLNEDDHLYNKFLQHKISGKLDNLRLRKTLEERKWSIDDFEGSHFFETFECFICDNINNIPNILNRNIYNCPAPISPLTGKRNESNWWHSHWKEGKCQAHVLKQFVNNSTIKKFTKEMFDNEVTRLMINDAC